MTVIKMASVIIPSILVKLDISVRLEQEATMTMVLLIDKIVSKDSIAQLSLLIKSHVRLAPLMITLGVEMKTTANRAPSVVTVRDMAIQVPQWNHVQKVLFVQLEQLIQIQILNICVHVGINVLPVE